MDVTSIINIILKTDIDYVPSEIALSIFEYLPFIHRFLIYKTMDCLEDFFDIDQFHLIHNKTINSFYIQHRWWEYSHTHKCQRYTLTTTLKEYKANNEIIKREQQFFNLDILSQSPHNSRELITFAKLPKSSINDPDINHKWFTNAVINDVLISNNNHLCSDYPAICTFCSHNWVVNFVGDVKVIKDKNMKNFIIHSFGNSSINNVRKTTYIEDSECICDNEIINNNIKKFIKKNNSFNINIGNVLLVSYYEKFIEIHNSDFRMRLLFVMNNRKKIKFIVILENHYYLPLHISNLIVFSLDKEFCVKKILCTNIMCSFLLDKIKKEDVYDFCKKLFTDTKENKKIKNYECVTNNDIKIIGETIKQLYDNYDNIHRILGNNENFYLSLHRLRCIFNVHEKKYEKEYILTYLSLGKIPFGDYQCIDVNCCQDISYYLKYYEFKDLRFIFLDKYIKPNRFIAPPSTCYYSLADIKIPKNNNQEVQLANDFKIICRIDRIRSINETNQVNKCNVINRINKHNFIKNRKHYKKARR